MVQKINPHPAPGCNRSPLYYVLSKDAILGSVPSISSEVLALAHFRIFTLLFEGKKRSMAATALLIFATFSSNVIIAIKCIRTEERPFGFFMPVLFVIFLWRFYVFFLGPTGSKARPLLYCLWALQPPNLVLILQHTGFEIISEGVNIRILKPF